MNKGRLTTQIPKPVNTSNNTGKSIGIKVLDTLTGITTDYPSYASAARAIPNCSPGKIRLRLSNGEK